MPELERFILHRLTELEAHLRRAVETHDWTGFYPALHHFCANDLSSFYFDVRKDSVYCDRPDHPTRKAARTVLDHLHGALCTWLAPVLAFTADEAWVARYGQQTSVHLVQLFATSAQWMDASLGERWETIRSYRREITVGIEELRRLGSVKSSLGAMLLLPEHDQTAGLLSDDTWAELAIVSAVRRGKFATANVSVASGNKCARCWKILPEVGTIAAHPTLCLRCADAVDSGLVGG